MSPPESDAPGVIAPPPVIYLGFLGVGLVLDYLWPISFVPAELRYSLGFALMVIPLVIMPFVLMQFRKARTSFDFRKPAQALVTGGLYRFSRNPGYLSLTLLWVGIGIAADKLWILIMLIPILLVMHQGVILREERHLERTFGEEYTRYKASVRRWL